MKNDQLTEREVLQRLDLESFEGLGKKDVIRLGTLLPQMEPEVAKKALEQFPEFAKTMGTMMSEYKETLAHGMESNAEGMRACAESCGAVLDALRRELDKDTLSFEERAFVIDRMMQVSRMLGEKDSENKKFLWGMAGIAAAAVAVVGGIAAGVLGLKLSKGKDETR